MVFVTKRPSKKTKIPPATFTIPAPVNALAPPASTLVKLGSIAVHVDEALSTEGHEFDWGAARQLLVDPEVVAWIEAMTKLGFMPVKRNNRGR
jgi:hypothetical protein